MRKQPAGRRGRGNVARLDRGLRSLRSGCPARRQCCSASPKPRCKPPTRRSCAGHRDGSAGRDRIGRRPPKDPAASVGARATTAVVRMAASSRRTAQERPIRDPPRAAVISLETLDDDRVEERIPREHQAEPGPRASRRVGGRDRPRPGPEKMPDHARSAGSGPRASMMRNPPGSRWMASRCRPPRVMLLGSSNPANATGPRVRLKSDIQKPCAWPDQRGVWRGVGTGGGRRADGRAWRARLEVIQRPTRVPSRMMSPCSVMVGWDCAGGSKGCRLVGGGGSTDGLSGRGRSRGWAGIGRRARRAAGAGAAGGAAGRCGELAAPW